MKLKYSICALFAALLFALPSCGNGSLKDITKPYLGAYECESAKLGEKEYMDEFSYIRLELNLDETFSLYYCTKGGQKREETGTYVYDEKEETLQLSAGENGEFKRKFPLKKGVLTVSLTIGNKILLMKFEQK